MGQTIRAGARRSKENTAKARGRGGWERALVMAKRYGLRARNP